MLSYINLRNSFLLVIFQKIGLLSVYLWQSVAANTMTTEANVPNDKDEVFTLKWFTVDIMNWLIVDEYQRHIWLYIFSLCPSHNPMLLTASWPCQPMTDHGMFIISNTTVVASGTGTACPFWAPDFTSGYSLCCFICSFLLRNPILVWRHQKSNVIKNRQSKKNR